MTNAPGPEWVDQWQQTDTLLALRELSDLARRVTPALARRAGLTHTEMETLEAIMASPMGPSEVAQRLGVSTAAASGIVNRLVRRGHAERHDHPGDRRRTVVAVTESGRAELVGHLIPMFVELARLDAGLSDTEREVVLRYLEGASAAFRRLL